MMTSHATTAKLARSQEIGKTTYHGAECMVNANARGKVEEESRKGKEVEEESRKGEEVVERARRPAQEPKVTKPQQRLPA